MENGVNGSVRDPSEHGPTMRLWAYFLDSIRSRSCFGSTARTEQVSNASAWVTEVRAGLTAAEATSGSARQSTLTGMASQICGQAGQSGDAAKVRMLADALRGLAGS